MTQGQSAANAEFTIDGVTFSRATNIIDDVVPGMSLTLILTKIPVNAAVKAAPNA